MRSSTRSKEDQMIIPSTPDTTSRNIGVLAFCILVRSVLCTSCGRSRLYMHESSERSPPHLFLYLVLIQKQKYGNKLIALAVLRTRELLKFIETKINLTMILTQA